MLLSFIAKYDTLRVLFAFLLMMLVAGCNSEDIANSINPDNAPGDLNSPENKTLFDVRLSWSAPSERENKEPISLSEISGYKVYYGTSQRDYDNSINIKDSTADGYTFRNLAPGTYYFALTTYDTGGRESRLSAEVKIVV